MPAASVPAVHVEGDFISVDQVATLAMRHFTVVPLRAGVLPATLTSSGARIL